MIRARLHIIYKNRDFYTLFMDYQDSKTLNETLKIIKENWENSMCFTFSLEDGTVLFIPKEAYPNILIIAEGK